MISKEPQGAPCRTYATKRGRGVGLVLREGPGGMVAVTQRALHEPNRRAIPFFLVPDVSDSVSSRCSFFMESKRSNSKLRQTDDKATNFRGLFVRFWCGLCAVFSHPTQR